MIALDMDMPEKCNDCPCMVHYFGDTLCKADGHIERKNNMWTRVDTHDVHGRRPDWCPWVEIKGGKPK